MCLKSKAVDQIDEHEGKGEQRVVNTKTVERFFQRRQKGKLMAVVDVGTYVKSHKKKTTKKARQKKGQGPYLT